MDIGSDFSRKNHDLCVKFQSFWPHLVEFFKPTLNHTHKIADTVAGVQEIMLCLIWFSQSLVTETLRSGAASIQQENKIPQEMCGHSPTTQ